MLTCDYSQYAHPEAFNDITEGNNEGCSSPDETTLWGFPAAAGWDPVTGLGYDSGIFSASDDLADSKYRRSPNFTALETVLVGL